MKYKRCTKSELQRFVTNRGIRVPPSLPPIYRRGKRVTFKRDYIAALKKADTLTTFHFFLDLPPEMRTRIYKELLVFKYSHSCHPQILSTSRRINSEATNILYGQNWLLVNICRDELLVHGEPCPGYTTGGSRPSHQHIAYLQWPRLLRRAQFIQISAPDPTWLTADNQVSTSRDICIGNVIYSLCRFLRHSNFLRRIDLDLCLHPTTPLQDMQLIYHPLHLIGQIDVQITIPSSTEPIGLDSFATPRPLAAFRYSGLLPTFEVFDTCVDVRAKLSKAFRPSPMYPIQQASLRRFSKHAGGRRKDPEVLFRLAIEELRTLMASEGLRLWLVKAWLIKKIHELLLFDIELHVHHSG